MYIHSSSTILVYRSRVRNDICGTYDTVAHAFDWCLVRSPRGPLPRGRCRGGPLAALYFFLNPASTSRRSSRRTSPLM